MIATDYGLGKHILLLPLDTVQGFLKVCASITTTIMRLPLMTNIKAFYVQNATYCSSTCFIKLALLLQYLRVFKRGTKLYNTTLGLTIFTALWGFAYSFMAWVPCIPVSTYWDLSSSGNNCYGYGSHYPAIFVGTYESHTAVNMVLDGVLLSIPLPLLFKDRPTQAARVRLIALLSMGCM